MQKELGVQRCMSEMLGSLGIPNCPDEHKVPGLKAYMKRRGDGLRPSRWRDPLARPPFLLTL